MLMFSDRIMEQITNGDPKIKLVKKIPSHLILYLVQIICFFYIPYPPYDLWLVTDAIQENHLPGC